MKTLIVGTGVIGVIHGWALHEVGAEVAHFVRPGRAQQFPAQVRLDLLDERKAHPPKATHSYPIHCVESVAFANGCELIIIMQTADEFGMEMPNQRALGRYLL